MGEIIKAIAIAVIQCTYGAVVEIVRDQQLKRAKQRVQFLEGYIAEKDKTDKLTKEYADAVKELDATKNAVMTLEEKIAKIRKFNSKVD